jgi:hypothetical protein
MHETSKWRIDWNNQIEKNETIQKSSFSQICFNGWSIFVERLNIQYSMLIIHNMNHRYQDSDQD